MFRRSPRFIALLLWLVIALLPIRAFASAVMPVMMAGLPASVVSAPAPDAVVTMPCHAAMADAADDAADATHTCSLCDLCHSSVAVAPQAAVVLPAAHEQQPHGASPADIEPRAPGSLFRPPRTLLV